MVLAACVCQLDILYKYKKQETMTMRVLSQSLRNLVFVVNVVANRKRLSRLVSPQCGPWLSFSVMTRHSDCMTTEISTEHGEMHADSSHPGNLLSVWVTYLMLASRDFCNLWNHHKSSSTSYSKCGTCSALFWSSVGCLVTFTWTPEQETWNLCWQKFKIFSHQEKL